MSTTDQMALRLISAGMLYDLHGAQAICGDVSLPDGTIPVLNLYRMDLAEWHLYRAICAEAANKLTKEDIFSCC